MIELTCWIANF